MDPAAKNKLWLFGLLWWSLVLERAWGASFYGDGFVQLKATESSDQNVLRVRFRTSSTDGLLFLAAGQSSFLLLELVAGGLQVKVDLGSGEHILESERGINHNDLAWHSVEVHHVHPTITLTVDKNSHARVQMTESHTELKIVNGLYVGGSGRLDKSYLPKNTVGFRGCMEDVTFNSHNLLSSLRPYTGYKIVHEVSLGCSPQFFASEEDPISFFSSRAYMSFPTWKVQHTAVFESVVHTSVKEGIILYSSAKDGDFIALEIQDGFPVAVIGKSEVKIELRATTFISDRKWHTIKLHLSSRSFELSVNGEIVKSSIGGRSRGFQLKGYMFVGGVDDSTRPEVRKTGSASASGKGVRGGSFKGCLRNIKVNSVKMGLSAALVTKDISVGCELEAPPDPPTPVSGTIPPQTIFPSAAPTQPFYMSTLAAGLDRRFGWDFVQLKNLVVAEGGRASLEAKHIKVFLDFKSLGIRQSQIMFRIQEQPVQGQLRLDVDPDQEENTFSMLDLWHGRVMYVHGGSEEPDDFFVLSIFCSSRKQVPSYLTDGKLYRFEITVTPTNDAPELSLPEGNLFILLENSKKCLTTDVLKATDIDSNHTQLVFSVLGNLNADAGFLEMETKPGKAVTSFSYADLDEMRVYYVHTGVRNSRIVLRVSDGEKVSNTVVLRVMAVALEYTIANNTGIEVVQGETAVISSKLLAVKTNTMKQAVDIRYDVVEPPQFGELQRLHSSGEWRHTESFSQRLLDKERLRYISTFPEVQTSNVTDSFKCRVNVAARATTDIVFPISVTWVRYNLVKNTMINMDKVRKVTLSSDYLLATAEGVTLSEDELLFRVLTIPKKGKLLLDTEVLRKNSTFSQKDLTDQKVHYVLVDRPHEDTTDRFKFQLVSKHAQSQNSDFQFSIKADVNSVFLKNEGFSLQEGESKLITKDDLFAETLLTKDMYYTVIKGPIHGKLARITQSNSNASYDNILTFSNHDIQEERLIYIHDDSETTEDEFTFIVSTSEGFRSTVAEDEVGSKEGSFNISIQLLNDQKPIRLIDKVFHVVKDGQKLLTIEDLHYHDPDSDFDDDQLIYTRRGIPVGDLVLVNDTSHQLFQFRQKDLEDKKVLFVHKGATTGRFVLFISDGKHFISSLLDISAQEPFLKIANNSGLLVQKGRSVTFTTSNFSVASNLDIRKDQEIILTLSEVPKHGSLFNNGTKTESFTLSDIKSGLVSYRHNDDKYLADYFNLTVKAKNLEVTERVKVKVFLESHQRPPIVQHLNTLLVEEGKPVKIDETKLEVTHEDNTPSEIVFTVKVFPSHGFLRRFVEAEERYVGTEQSPVTTFTQDDVNSGNIQYVQVEPNKTSDTFVLYSSNGVTAAGDIRMSIDIIPLFIPLRVTNVTLNEGASKALTQDVLRVDNRHFSGINFFYGLTAHPQHGHIEHSRHPGVPINTFTRRQVEHEFIYYVHDGSETLTDNFTVVINDTGLRKQSSPRTVYIEVAAVNDESPVITTNRVLRVWVASVTEIGQEDLRAQDLDTPPEELHFMVTPPSNGHLALKSAPMKAVLNFTQAHIDQGQLLFVHKGAMSGGFNFQVNDGVNFSPRQIFSITAKSLVLNLERNGPLRVFPGSSTPLTNKDLKASTNDVSNSTNRVIEFNVLRAPKLGRLVRLQAEKAAVDISTFTQEMVDRKEVVYVQSAIESVGWEAMDSVTFSVVSPPVSLEGQTFKIDISYENTGPEHNTVLLANTGAEVKEGESIIIDEQKLDASNLMSKLPLPDRSSHEVWFQVTSLPRHGVIVVGERNLTMEKPNFSQFIVNKYGITYKHDNSETTRDSFEFSAWVNAKGKTAQRPQGEKEVVAEQFHITITPVNDQPPLLKTKAPALRVVQGDTVVLGPENLTVLDLDNPPEEIRFTVISKPSNGHLAIEGTLNESAVEFTQAQVNNRSVFFVQDGSAASGAFYFSVSDGHHKPIYKLFNLQVIEITVSLVNCSQLLLQQGKSSASLTHYHLAAETSGKDTTILYQITKPPTFGKLVKDNQEVTKFLQDDIQAGRLSYHMTSLSSSEDSFEFTIFTSEANLTGNLFNIIVRPLIHLGLGLRIPNGVMVKLNPSFLNASELAELSGSDPVFEVVSHPKYGKVVQTNPKASRRTLESFTFQELLKEKVVLQLSANMTGVEELNDSLVFVLKAETVPPARGKFHFTLVPFDPALFPTTPSPISTTSPPGHTLVTVSKNGTVTPAPPAVLLSTPSGKSQQKLKGRRRWGSTNRTSLYATTLGRPTETEELPFQNTPVRVESYPQKSSNPLLVILPLLALLLLVIIFVVLVVYLRHHRRRKQNIASSHQPPSPSMYTGPTQRSTTVPEVTVTPLTMRSAGSPALQRFGAPLRGSPYGSVDSNLLVSSWSNSSPTASSQVIRTATPTLQRNQYWV